MRVLSIRVRMKLWNRFVGSLKIYFTGILFILFFHLFLGLFMAYEMSVVYSSLWVGVVFYFLSFLFLFPLFSFFTKKRLHFFKQAAYFGSGAIVFLGVHLWGVMNIHLPISTWSELEARQTRLYVSRFLLGRAQRDVSEKRQKLLRSQLLELEKTAQNRLAEF